MKKVIIFTVNPLLEKSHKSYKLILEFSELEELLERYESLLHEADDAGIEDFCESHPEAFDVFSNCNSDDFERIFADNLDTTVDDDQRYISVIFLD